MIRKLLNRDEFDRNLFRVLILFSIPFWFLAAVKGVLFDSNITVIVLDVMNALMALLLLILHRRSVKQNVLRVLYSIYWCPVFILYLVNTGGIDGPFSYAFFPIMILTVILVENPYRSIVVAFLTISTVVVALEASFVKDIIVPTHNAFPLAFEYLFVAYMIAVLTGLMKYHYDRGRVRMMIKNEEMKSVNIELDEKRKELIDQKNLIMNIQDNLGVLIKDRTQEQELKRRQLEEYAYDNAHIVRGPLTNIIGLVNLLEKELKAENIEFEKIKTSANQLDFQIKRINQILK